MFIFDQIGLFIAFNGLNDHLTMLNLVNLSILVLVGALQSVPVDMDICSKKFVSPNGNTCGYCPQGYFKAADCTLNGSIAACLQCPEREFQPDCNIANTCAKCETHCLYPNMETVRQCSQIADMKCQCVDGYYWQSHTSDDGVCLRNKCPAGKGTIHDKSCKPCVDGETFSNSVSLDSCQPCTLCATYKTTCTINHDAECNPQTTPTETGNGWTDETIGLAISLPTLFIALIALMAVWYCRRNKRLCFSPCNIHDNDETAGGGSGETAGGGSSNYTGNGHVTFHNTADVYVQMQNGLQDTTQRQQRNDLEDNNNPTVELFTHRENHGNHCNTNTADANANENIPTGSAPVASERDSMLERDQDSVDPMDSDANQENRNDTGDNDMYSNVSGNGHDESENKDEICATIILSDHSKHSLDERGVSIDALSTETVTRPKHTSGYGCQTTPRGDINVAQVHSGSELYTMPHAKETRRETDWRGILGFISEKTKPDDFKRFFRKLVPVGYDADAWIAEAEVDYKLVIEQQYQLLLRWRRAVPKSSEVDIIKTLKACQLNSLLWKFEEFLGKRSDPNHTLEKNDKSKSMPIFAQETNTKIKTENDRLSLGNNTPVMENLKEFRHDCVTNPVMENLKEFRHDCVTNPVMENLKEFRHDCVINPVMENLKEFRHGCVTGELINNGDTTGINMISQQTPVTEL